MIKKLFSAKQFMQVKSALEQPNKYNLHQLSEILGDTTYIKTTLKAADNNKLILNREIISQGKSDWDQLTLLQKNDHLVCLRQRFSGNPSDKSSVGYGIHEIKPNEI